MVYNVVFAFVIAGANCCSHPRFQFYEIVTTRICTIGHCKSYYMAKNHRTVSVLLVYTEILSLLSDRDPYFLNVYGAQESIPRNEFR
jgi:hypothetical protein